VCTTACRGLSSLTLTNTTPDSGLTYIYFEAEVTHISDIELTTCF